MARYVTAAADQARRGAASYAGHLDAERDEHAALVARILKDMEIIRRQRAAGSVTLQDGRRLHHFTTTGRNGTLGSCRAWLDTARRLGGNLVADGGILTVVEPTRGLAPELIGHLRREAGGIILALRDEHRQRCRSLEVGDAWEPEKG